MPLLSFGQHKSGEIPSGTTQDDEAEDQTPRFVRCRRESLINTHFACFGENFQLFIGFGLILRVSYLKTAFSLFFLKFAFIFSSHPERIRRHKRKH